jgi:VanZ family protein
VLPLRYEKRWRVAGIIILIVVLAFAVLPALSFLPDIPQVDLLSLDKWLHIMTFIFLSLWFTGQYERRFYWRLIAALTAFGVLIELGQGVIPYRSAEWMDLVADIIGLVIGLFVAITGAGGWSLRLEQWLEKRQVGVAVD